MSQNIENAIYAIIEMDGKQPKEKVLPKLLGTGFFVSQEEFVTAAHVLMPNYTYDIYLINSTGEILKNPSITYYKPSEDYTICRISRHSSEFLRASRTDITNGVKAYAVGFPLQETSINKPLLKMVSTKFELISARIQISYSRGNIVKVQNIIRTDKDTNMQVKSLHVLLNFPTPKGYSGGPIMLVENDEVVGLVSSSDLEAINGIQSYPGAGIRIKGK
ncbi:MAG: serine protease [Candidatus Nomurabacteria bacterium]|nr:serine protease [Candidatus Nomurabacteria bacterium]